MKNLFFPKERNEFDALRLNDYLINIVTEKEKGEINMIRSIDSLFSFGGHEDRIDFLYETLSLQNKKFQIVPGAYFVQGHQKYKNNELVVSTHDLLSKCDYHKGIRSEKHKDILKKLFTSNVSDKKVIDPKEDIFGFIRKYKLISRGKTTFYRAKLGEKYESSDFGHYLILVPCTYKK